MVARSDGVAQICYPEHVEALFKTFAARGGKHEAIACWQLLFYALWHAVHVEGRVPLSDVFATLDRR
jgi:asparagine synthase (glutamine-hydrolysing)